MSARLPHFLYELRGWLIYTKLRLLYALRDPYDLEGKVPVDWEVYRYGKCESVGSIFKTTGDMALPYCHAHAGTSALVRTSYVDGSCLYPDMDRRQVAITYHDDTRELL
jgi:hypothetical protein